MCFSSPALLPNSQCVCGATIPVKQEIAGMHVSSAKVSFKIWPSDFSGDGYVEFIDFQGDEIEPDVPKLKSTGKNGDDPALAGKGGCSRAAADAVGSLGP